MHELLTCLKKRPVIAAVREAEKIHQAVNSPADAVFLLGGSILTMGDMTAIAKDRGKRVFVHLDLCEGLGRDAAAVEWCARSVRPDGLISTRTPLLRKARECGLITIQRLFVMDSGSLFHGIKLLSANPPDLVEVLPGLVGKAIRALVEALPCPVIAGGMITEVEEARAALASGARAISTSVPTLWDYSQWDAPQ